MIYATEQQVVVTAGIVVIVGLVALCIGVWWGIGRGWAEATEDARWEREQAKARRTHPVYRDPEERLRIPVEYRPAPIPGLGTPIWAGSPEEQTTLVNETVLTPTAVLSPESMSWTGEIAKMTAKFEQDMERLLSGTDEKLKEITRRS